MNDGPRLIHCDARVLHAPGECRFCDAYPERQAARVDEGVAFSGHAPANGQRPCPADAAVAHGERGDYNAWCGNVARPA